MILRTTNTTFSPYLYTDMTQSKSFHREAGAHFPYILMEMAFDYTSMRRIKDIIVMSYVLTNMLLENALVKYTAFGNMASIYSVWIIVIKSMFTLCSYSYLCSMSCQLQLRNTRMLHVYSINCLIWTLFVSVYCGFISWDVVNISQVVTNNDDGALRIMENRNCHLLLRFLIKNGIRTAQFMTYKRSIVFPVISFFWQC